MRHIKNLLILTLLCSSAGFLTNCSCSSNVIAEDSISIKLDEPYLNMSINSTQTIDVTVSFDDVAISIDNSNIVSATYFEKQLTLTSSNNSGTCRVKIYKESDETIFKDILVVVSKETTTTELSILNEGTTTYKLGETFTRNGLEVALVTKEGENVINTLRLDDYEVFLSIEEGTTLDTIGKRTIYVSTLDPQLTPISYEIEVVENELYPLKRLTNMFKNENYTISFRADYNSLMTIEGKLLFNQNYFINTYMDLYFAKDNNGVFKFEYSDDTSSTASIVTSNGYFDDVENATLYDVVGLFSSTIGLSDFKDSYYDEVKVSGSTYTFSNKDLLTLFWNNTLGFNGVASELNLSVEEDAISYVIYGKLNNGLVLTFTGAIYDIGETKEERIETYLNHTHSVNKIKNTTVDTLVSGFRSCNYTFAEDSFNIYVTPTFVFIEDASEEGSGTGLIERDDGVYNFTITDKVLTLGSKSSGLNSIEDSIYNFDNYSLFDESEVTSFYTSSYYGGYINFNTVAAKELTANFFKLIYGDLSNYTPFASIFSSDSTLSKATLDVYLKTSSGGMTYVEGDFINIGSTSVDYIK